MQMVYSNYYACFFLIIVIEGVSKTSSMEEERLTHVLWSRLCMLMVYSRVTTSFIADFFFSPFLDGAIFCKLKVCKKLRPGQQIKTKITN